MMGSLAVADMAHDTSAARKPLHPFFAPNRQCAPVSEPDTSEPETPSANGPPGEKAEKNGPAKARDPPRKRRKIEADNEESEDWQEEPKKRRGRKPKPPVGGNITSHFKKLAKEEDASMARPAAEPTIARSQAQDYDTVPGQAHQSGVIRVEEDTATTAKRQAGETVGDQQAEKKSSANAGTATETGAKASISKQAWFDPKTGRFGTLMPVRLDPESIDSEEDTEGPSNRRLAQKPPKIVTISYGQDDESRLQIGGRINKILGASPAPSSSSSGRGGPRRTRKPATPKRPSPKEPSPKAISKVTHPFFLGKARPSDDAAPAQRSSPLASPKLKLLTSTPASPQKRRVASSSIKAPFHFGAKNATLRFLGSKHPAWPCKEAMHVRGDDDGVLLNGASNIFHGLGPRRSKGHAVEVGNLESILRAVEARLSIKNLAEGMANLNTDNFLRAPPELRLPKKHLEAGRKLQSRILPELRTFRHAPPAPIPKLPKRRGRPAAKSKKGPESADELLEQPHNAKTKQPPPQLERLFSQIQSGLSAFDRSTCETSNWTHKYAPESTVEVLQEGEEVTLLKKWLTAMMVQSVDTGGFPASDTTPRKVGRGRKKVKKSSKYLDEFIVYSDDEDFVPDNLTDDDDADWGPSGVNGILKKTVVRKTDCFAKGQKGQRLSNGLVISGPHGCGKTAAVYAVAKELGFEVFELNSGSRRSGKDITDKIGDMTRNHLVHRSHVASTVEDGTAKTAVVDEEVAAEVKSGKQATMDAFFRTKTNSSAGLTGPAKAKKPAQVAAAAGTSPRNDAKKQPPKNKKQSLILLEEVDVLFEEDRQFWNTVVGLMVQSKRPFIMTCNDETLVPLGTLDLHGIFRLSPPPRELAVDRLLLIAANEGHALSRNAVELLFESRHQDLRAATMDLQFWCQFGIGDGRGGFDWFFPRLPKGIDLNEDGEVVRVVSENAYCTGMERLARDSIVQVGPAPHFVEEELRRQSWESWQLDLGRWLKSMGLESWADDVGNTVSGARGRLASLEVYENLADAMSTADRCSSGAFSTQEAMDATLPSLSPKAREDIVQGRAWLDTPQAIRSDNMATLLPTSISSLAQSSLLIQTEQLIQTHSQASARPNKSTLAPLTETETLAQIQSSFNTPAPDHAAVSRFDFALAFDCMAADSGAGGYTPTSYLDPSVFDRTLRLISHDVAPFVRGILAHERRIQERRQRMGQSNLLSSGGDGSSGGSGDSATRKRTRTTRSARSALEGGSRSEGIRAERPWFRAELNWHLVMRTAGKGWDEAAWDVIRGDGKDTYLDKGVKAVDLGTEGS